MPTSSTLKPPVLERCPVCRVRPGRCHKVGCDVERCSHCGLQRLGCTSPRHDPAFSRWTGLWPGEAECRALGYLTVWDPVARGDPKRYYGHIPVPAGTPGASPDLNRFKRERLHRIFHVKPRVPRGRRAPQT